VSETPGASREQSTWGISSTLGLDETSPGVQGFGTIRDRNSNKCLVVQGQANGSVAFQYDRLNIYTTSLNSATTAITAAKAASTMANLRARITSGSFRNSCTFRN
jgi:hypothetical protein